MNLLVVSQLEATEYAVIPAQAGIQRCASGFRFRHPGMVKAGAGMTEVIFRSQLVVWSAVLLKRTYAQFRHSGLDPESSKPPLNDHPRWNNKVCLTP